MRISKYLVLLIVLLLMVMKPGFAHDPVEKYIKRHQGMTVKLMHEYCIPASVILGVAIVESASGRSKNARLLHNHFGTKTKKKRQWTATGGSNYLFFKSAWQSYSTFCNYLSRREFYDDLQGNMDYERWITELNKSRYSSGKNKWKNMVLSIIRKYNLSELDKL